MWILSEIIFILTFFHYVISTVNYAKNNIFREWNRASLKWMLTNKSELDELDWKLNCSTSAWPEKSGKYSLLCMWALSIVKCLLCLFILFFRLNWIMRWQRHIWILAHFSTNHHTFNYFTGTELKVHSIKKMKTDEKNSLARVKIAVLGNMNVGKSGEFWNWK